MQYPICTLDNGDNVYLVLPKLIDAQLKTKSFRGKSCRKAGNFSCWNSFHEMQANRIVFEAIKRDVLERIRSFPEKKKIKGRLEIDFGRDVGWSPTDDVDRYEGYELELFEVNAKVDGLRVVFPSEHLAPLTSYITIVYEIKHEAEQKNWAVMIYSVHPGIDIGPLEVRDGEMNISCRERVVFFDYEHPGR